MFRGIKEDLNLDDGIKLIQGLHNLPPKPLHTLIEVVIIAIGIVAGVVETIQHWPH